ncbi:LysM domain-containing protein [Rhizobium terrae]|uniref:LysM domain-containing protein n=1 Tax=Rhizobium terrae TaxID=2171756 RepID=UPI000E3E8F2F|nr:LysM domain-containing protein [Rhizobium terrae]
MFDDKSRYAGLPTASLAKPDGRRAVAYVTRRILPLPEAYAVAGRIGVTDSDRIDNVAYKHLGLPTAFWQIADANEAMHPGELTSKAGRRLVIPLPFGLGGGR